MIMNLSDKPFACDEENCYRTFANEDHLNAHKRKHSMNFNLDLSAKNNEAVLGDQTPTPTSFFRNCEEVGLFQDLQNVNPFEETFKKAIESSGSKGTLSDVTNEDTLHTPHIFPSVEEPSHNNILDTNNSELSIVSLIEIPQISHKTELNEISYPNTEDKQTYLRNKLKEALMKKDKLKSITNVENTPSFTDIPIIESGNIVMNDKPKLSKTFDKSNIERIREINRVAQMKCRVKKKRQMDKMVTELLNFKKENEKLRRENVRLNTCNIHLWKAIEELGGSKDRSLIDRIKASLEEIDSDKPVPIPPSKISPKQLPSLVPADTILVPNKNTSPSVPIIYNLVPVQIINGAPPPVTLISKQKIIPRILKKS